MEKDLPALKDRGLATDRPETPTRCDVLRKGVDIAQQTDWHRPPGRPPALGSSAL